MTPRLKEYYESTIRPQLTEEFSYSNPLRLPRLEKIIVNMGVGEAVTDSKKIDGAVADLTAITGQKTHRRASAQVGRNVQTSRGYGSWREGDSQAAAYV